MKSSERGTPESLMAWPISFSLPSKCSLIDYSIGAIQLYQLTDIGGINVFVAGNNTHIKGKTCQKIHKQLIFF